MTNFMDLFTLILKGILSLNYVIFCGILTKSRRILSGNVGYRIPYLRVYINKVPHLLYLTIVLNDNFTLTYTKG